MCERGAVSPARSASVLRLGCDSCRPGILCLLAPLVVGGGAIEPVEWPYRALSSLGVDSSRGLWMLDGTRDGGFRPLGRTFSSCDGGRSMIEVMESNMVQCVSSRHSVASHPGVAMVQDLG